VARQSLEAEPPRPEEIGRRPAAASEPQAAASLR